MAIIKKALPLAVTIFLLLAVLAEEKRCEQQFRSQQQLSPCKDYLHDSTQVGTEWRSPFVHCCRLLDQIDEQCRCEGIKRIVQQQRQQQQQQIRGEQLREMMKTAQSLPALCRVGPQRCDITALLSQVLVSF